MNRILVVQGNGLNRASFLFKQKPVADSQRPKNQNQGQGREEYEPS